VSPYGRDLRFRVSLLPIGADVNAKTREGYTALTNAALSFAIERKSKGAEAALRTAGAND